MKRNKIWRIGVVSVLGLIGLGCLVFLGIVLELRASLPELEGKISLSFLEHPVVVSRDEVGFPLIKADSRKDAAAALGFLHGQERFFQMDLMRRSASGRLSELFGANAFELDKKNRLFLLSQTAEKVIKSLSPDEVGVLKAYTLGVNAGLKKLGQVPFEYLLLRCKPEPWHMKDSILVIHSMFMNLQDFWGRGERNMGVAADVLPEELFSFLMPQGTEWDAPLSGAAFQQMEIPGPEVLNLRDGWDPDKVDSAKSAAVPGSNNWAVSGARTVHGGAILADDMHLSIRVPNTWYRASLIWSSKGAPFQLTGVTLPGFPGVVVGSNGHVAWGFTNSYGDFLDVIRLKAVSGHPDQYQTVEGAKSIKNIKEQIQIKGQPPREVDLPWTEWGPVVGINYKGEKEVVHMTAVDPEAVNMKFLQFETCTNIDEAVYWSTRCAIPGQNLALADSTGRIGWTLMGKFPKRVGFSGRLPKDWSKGECRWDGFLEPDQVPRLLDPENGQVWTANARVVDGDNLKKIGDGGYGLGARAKQIRDDLADLDQMSEKDLLNIQLDNRALFLERWRDLILKHMPKPEGGSDLEQALQFVQGWGGAAAVNSVGYRIVRGFRVAVFSDLRQWLFRDCYQRDPEFNARRFPQLEGPIWEVVSKRPMHLLISRYSSWEAYFEKTLLDVWQQILSDGDQVEDWTWGHRNTTHIQHPLSRAVPILAPFLDMPELPLPGDVNMPRVQTPTFGASMRMVVSPGKEEQGYFHLPCGQSGHPLSPFYRAGHLAWVEGRPTPFLPGKESYRLELQP